MLDLRYVLRRAWQIFWHHRTLWLFGCLASLGTVGLRLSLGSRGLWEQAAHELSPSLEKALLGLLSSPYLTAVAIALAVLGLAASFGLMLLGAIASAALVDQVRAAEERGVVRWPDGWHAGRRQVWVIVLMRLLAGLPALAITLLGALPLLAWAAWRLISHQRAAVELTGVLLLPLAAFGCLLPALCLAVALAIPLHVLLRLAVCGRVLQGLSLRESGMRAWITLRQHSGAVALLWLAQMGIVIGAVVALGLPLTLLALAVLLAAGLAELLSALATLVLTAIGGLLLGSLVVISGGLVETFVSIMWTLAYREFGGLGLTGVEPRTP